MKQIITLLTLLFWLDNTSSLNATELVLRKGWDTHMQIRGVTGKEILKLFGTFAKPKLDLTGDSSVAIYREIHYLDKLESAKASIFKHMPSVLVGKSQINTSGFPQGSIFFYDYKYDNIEPGFGHILFITDAAEQVIGIQLLGNAPAMVWLANHTTEWSTYNFIQTRKKGISDYQIRHIINMNLNQVIRLDSELIDASKKSREWVKLFIARKFMDIVIYTLEKAKQ